MTLEAPLWLEAVSGDALILQSARQYRTVIDAMFGTQGPVGLTDLKVTQRAAGANMSVDVAAGLVVITGGSVAAQGKYVARNTAAFNVPITTAPTTGTRTDIIVAKLLDKQADGGTQYAWTLSALAGTVTVPASAVLLAQINVGTNVASITNSAITDQRSIAHVAPGLNPAIQAAFTGSMSLTNSAGWVALTGWNAAGSGGAANQGGMVLSTSAGVTVPRSGPYWLGGGAVFDSVFAGGRRGVGYAVNGTLLSPIAQSVVGDAGSGNNVAGVPFLEQLSAGDVVNLMVYQTAAGTLHVTGASLSIAYAG